MDELESDMDHKESHRKTKRPTRIKQIYRSHRIKQEDKEAN